VLELSSGFTNIFTAHAHVRTVNGGCHLAPNSNHCLLSWARAYDVIIVITIMMMSSTMNCWYWQ